MFYDKINSFKTGEYESLIKDHISKIFNIYTKNYDKIICELKPNLDKNYKILRFEKIQKYNLNEFYISFKYENILYDVFFVIDEFDRNIKLLDYKFNDTPLENVKNVKEGDKMDYSNILVKNFKELYEYIVKNSCDLNIKINNKNGTIVEVNYEENTISIMTNNEIKTFNLDLNLEDKDIEVLDGYFSISDIIEVDFIKNLSNNTIQKEIIMSYSLKEDYYEYVGVNFEIIDDYFYTAINIKYPKIDIISYLKIIYVNIIKGKVYDEGFKKALKKYIRKNIINSDIINEYSEKLGIF